MKNNLLIFTFVMLNTLILAGQNIEIIVTDTLECEVESYTYFVKIRHIEPLSEFYGQTIRHKRFDQFLLQNKYKIDYQRIGNNTKELLQEFDGAYKFIFKSNAEINEFRAKAEGLFVGEIQVSLHEVEIKYGEPEKIKLINKLVQKSNVEAELIAKALGNNVDEMIAVSDDIDSKGKRADGENNIRFRFTDHEVQLPNKEDIAVERKSLKVIYNLK